MSSLQLNHQMLPVEWTTPATFHSVAHSTRTEGSLDDGIPICRNRDWFWSNGSVPEDITAGIPYPSAWGTPSASYAGEDNDSDAHFQELQVIINTSFCGDWAGSVWSGTTTCSSLATTCRDCVANNPQAFQDAYWLIRSLNVTQQSDNTKREFQATEKER